MKLRLSLIVSAVTLAVCSQTAVFAKDGTYTATTLGRNGDVTVQVRILNNKIEDVKVLNWSETHPVADLPKLKVPQDVVKYQSTNVNNVAGATLTTFAIKAAVQDCLKQAGLNPKDYAKAVPQPKKAGGKVEEKTDVIVVGAGGAGLSAAVAAAQRGLNVIVVEKAHFAGGNTSVLGLILPSLEAGEKNGVWITALGILCGALFLNFTDRFTPHLHNIAGIDKEAHENNQSLDKVLLFVMAIAIHNLPEGLAAGVGFGGGDVGNAITVALGIAL